MAAAMMMGTCVPCFAQDNTDGSVTKTETKCSSDFSYDDEGNATKTTEVEYTQDGETKNFEYKEYIDAKTGEKTLLQVPILISNETTSEIKEFYMTPVSAESWGDNMLGDNTLAKDYERETDYAVSVKESDSKFDFKVVTADGKEHYFENIDLSDISRDQVTFSVEGNENDGYTLYNSINTLDIQD